MIIANPIYDSVFKFLLEDLDISRELLSAIIGEEILEIVVKPQEQTMESKLHLLSVYRVDFKALIQTSTGERKKVLIEIQKSSHSYDLMRFRRYLGNNYLEDDEIGGNKMVLPLLPIYFLGFNLSIKRPVLKIGRSYQDVGTGEIVEEKDNFIENLSHDCFVVQIRSLPHETRTQLERILSVFNQSFLFDTNQKWLLSYPLQSEDKLVNRMLKRLSFAAESSEMKSQIRLEETFDASLDSYLRAKDQLLEQKDAELGQKDAELGQKDAELGQKDAELGQKDAELGQKDAELGQKDAELGQKDAELGQKEKENQALLQRILELEKLQKK
jgi:hypothetical protein